MPEPLADWWVHTVSVQRLNPIGGAGGDSLAEPVNVVGFYRDGTRLVIDGNGKQVVSTAQFAFPLTVDPIPVGSLVTAPAGFGPWTGKVIVAQRGDGGGQPTPDHHEVSLG